MIKYIKRFAEDKIFAKRCMFIFCTFAYLFVFFLKIVGVIDENTKGLSLFLVGTPVILIMLGVGTLMVKNRDESK